MDNAEIKIRKRNLHFIILEDDKITENVKYFKTHEVSYMTATCNLNQENRFRHLEMQERSINKHWNECVAISTNCYIVKNVTHITSVKINYLPTITYQKQAYK